MRSPSVRSGGRWLMVGVLALMVAALAGPGATLSWGWAPTAVMAQGPTLSDEDEQWVQQKTEEICGAADCSDPEAIKTALRGCLSLATGGVHLPISDIHDPSGVRTLCGMYGERTRRGDSLSLEIIRRQVDEAVESEARRFGEAGASAEEVGTFSAGLRRCLVAGELVGESALERMRRQCTAVYYAADAAWVESRSQIFLLYLLSSGLDADAAAAALTKFRDCLSKSTEAAQSSGGWGDLLSFCLGVATPPDPDPNPAPTIGRVSCSPSTVETGERVTCSATIARGPVSGYQWSAPGGIPNSATGESFALQFITDGVKTVTLTVCNGQPSAQNPHVCSSETAAVTVTPVTPKISAVGCTAMVPARGVVSCSATVADAPGLTRGWSAPSGDPATGRGATFSTQYARAGSYTIEFTACIGSACANERRSVTVTAPVSTVCTQWDVSGSWQTSQGNGYNPSFSFQQSGTRISGTATVSGGEATRGGFTSPTGPVSGSLVGDKLDVTVTWTTRNGAVTGRYTATVVQGRLTNGNAGGVSWTGSGPTHCVS